MDARLEVADEEVRHPDQVQGGRQDLEIYMAMKACGAGPGEFLEARGFPFHAADER